MPMLTDRHQRVARTRNIQQQRARGQRRQLDGSVVAVYDALADWVACCGLRPASRRRAEHSARCDNGEALHGLSARRAAAARWAGSR